MSLMTCHGFIITGESDFSSFSVTFKGGAGVQSADLSHGFQGVVGRLRGHSPLSGAFAIAATATSAPAPAPLPPSASFRRPRADSAPPPSASSLSA